MVEQPGRRRLEVAISTLQKRSLFREVNERIREIHDGLEQDAVAYELLCECAGPECSERITVPVSVYETVRGERGRYLVAHGHGAEPGELVVGAFGTYWIVAAAQLAPPAASAA